MLTSLLHGLFSIAASGGALYPTLGGVYSLSHFWWFLCPRAWALGEQASVGVAWGFITCTSWVLEYRLNSGGTQA